MWSTTLLLLVSLLGASASQQFYYMDGVDSGRQFAAPDDSEAVVKAFLDKMTKTIESRDNGAIADLFTEDFFMKGCKGDYDKKRIISVIESIPAGTAFSFTFKSAKYIYDNKIDYSVIISGFGSTPVEAQFLLCVKSGKLSGGSVPSCMNSHFHGFISQDSAQTVVEKFIARMTKSIESKDESIIRGLFQPGFVFYGCKGTYNKDEVVRRLSLLPAGTKFSLTFKSAEDNGDSIKYRVSISGVDTSEVVAEFVLNKHEQQLESGNVPACQKTRMFKGGFLPTAEDYAKAFLKNAKAVIRRYDIGAVGLLFDDHFAVQGCKGRYDKAACVAQIGRIDTENPFDYEFISARFISDDRSRIVFTVKIYGIWDDFTAEFVFNTMRKVLLSGHYINCKTTGANRLIGDTIGRSFSAVAPRLRPNFHFHSRIGSSRRFRGLTAQESAQAVVETFLGKMIKSVESQDKAKILDLFQPHFSFKGCKAIYDREQSVGLFMMLPIGSKYSYEIKSVEDKGDNINCVLLANGLGQTAVEFDFVLNKNEQKLESAFMPVCPIKQRFAAPQTPDATETLKPFLTSLKETFDSRDFSNIGKFFDDNFVFKGCEQSYNKDETIAKINQMTGELIWYFTLKSANWNNNGQIEYIVTVSGALPGDFDAQFVYCPYRNVLKSGVKQSCLARRMFSRPCIDDLGLFC